MRYFVLYFPLLKKKFVNVLDSSKMYSADACQKKYVSQVKIFAPNSLTLPPRNVFCVAEFRLGERGILDNNMREREGNLNLIRDHCWIMKTVTECIVWRWTQVWYCPMDNDKDERENSNNVLFYYWWLTKTFSVTRPSRWMSSASLEVWTKQFYTKTKQRVAK